MLHNNNVLAPFTLFVQTKTMNWITYQRTVGTLGYSCMENRAKRGTSLAADTNVMPEDPPCASLECSREKIKKNRKSRRACTRTCSQNREDRSNKSSESSSTLPMIDMDSRRNPRGSLPAAHLSLSESDFYQSTKGACHERLKQNLALKVTRLVEYGSMEALNFCKYPLSDTFGWYKDNCTQTAVKCTKCLQVQVKTSIVDRLT